MLKSDIILTPIADSVQFLDISDAEYFSSKYANYISNSKLSLLNPKQDGSIQKYMEGFSSGKYSAAFEFGSAVHGLILQPECFYLEDKTSKPTAKAGAMIDAIFTFRQKGYTILKSIMLASNKVDYYKGKITAKIIQKLIKDGLSYYLFVLHYKQPAEKEPIFLNTKDQVRLQNCIQSVDNNRCIQNLLNPSYLFTKPLNVNEGTLLMDVEAKYKGKTYILKLKSKLDNFIIDFENNTLYLNDLKTTGFYLSHFPESFKTYHYDRQMAMYFWMLRMYVKQAYPDFHPDHFYANMVVVSTIPDHQSGVFKVDVESQKSGMNEFSYLLRCVVKILADEQDLDTEFEL